MKNKSKGVKKLGKIAKTVPAALPPEEEIKFPSSQQKDGRAKYEIAAQSDLQTDINIGKLLSAKII